MIAPLALAATTAVAALAFTRVFAGGAAVAGVVGAALLAHAIARLAAARGWSAPATGTAQVGGLVLVLTWATAFDTTYAGVPTASTLTTLARLVGEGFEELRTASAPVPGEGGLLVLAMVGGWLAGGTADWLAFRSRAVLSALVPALALFTLTAALGDGGWEAPLAGGLVAAGLVFVLSHSPAQTGGSHAWFAGERGSPRYGAVMRAGLPVVVVAALLAPTLGSRFPDARSVGLVEGSGRGGPRTRVTVSPLVDIRDRLTRNPPVEVFTVVSAEPEYWRLAALETFDGSIWSSHASYRGTSGRLPATTGGVTDAHLLDQSFTISNLAQFWLPAAYRPVSIDLAGARVNAGTLTLLTEQETSDGLSYRVVSEVPRYTAETLAATSGWIPDDVREAMTLPGGIPDAVARLARDVTAPVANPVAKLRALQDFFRTRFTYSEDVPPGHSGDRLVDFLLEHQTGYCEQFSSAFATMARSLGFPARVAVGFLPGTAVAPGEWRVETKDAHAWPEVFLDPFGWVAFEPTPTRSHPSPANHTGTYEAPPATTPPATAAPTATTAPAGDATATTVTTAASDVPAGGGASQPWTRRAGLLVAALVTATAALALLSLLARRRVTRRRRRQRDHRAAVLSAWDELVDRLREEGVGSFPTDTPGELAARAGARDDRIRGPLGTLRSLVDEASYAPRDPGADAARSAWAAVDTVVGVLDGDERPGARLARLLGPGVLRRLGR
jgi:transglutaminase-like putative cysteine protease